MYIMNTFHTTEAPINLEYKCMYEVNTLIRDLPSVILTNNSSLYNSFLNFVVFNEIRVKFVNSPVCNEARVSDKKKNFPH